MDEQGVRHNVGYWDNTIHHYDVPGNLRFRAYYRSSYEQQASEAWQQAHYYQGDGKLAVLERHDGHGEVETQGWITGTGLREEYRYDALGRRVLVWSRRGDTCQHTGCESSVRRAIWAGDQLVYETRGKGADSLLSSALENELPFGDGERGSPKAYGQVAYAHAGGIDHPLVVHRASTSTTFFPHVNWRGLYDGATNASGQLIPCYGSNPAPCANVPDIDWPGSATSAFIGATPSSRTTPAEWAGSLVTEQADASGLLYRRNRYYDPASGRFTQPDPIGLAGGLNAYGFANGDPVNYSDPYGLTACFTCIENYTPEDLSAMLKVYISTALRDGFGKANQMRRDILKIRGEAEGLARKTYGSENSPMGDAFKHAYGSCRITQTAGRDAAQTLGDGHERSPGADSPPGERARDSHNNNVGRVLGAQANADCAEKVTRALETTKQLQVKP